MNFLRLEKTFLIKMSKAEKWTKYIEELKKREKEALSELNKIDVIIERDGDTSATYSLKRTSWNDYLKQIREKIADAEASLKQYKARESKTLSCSTEQTSGEPLLKRPKPEDPSSASSNNNNDVLGDSKSAVGTTAAETKSPSTKPVDVSENCEALISAPKPQESEGITTEPVADANKAGKEDVFVAVKKEEKEKADTTAGKTEYNSGINNYIFDVTSKLNNVEAMLRSDAHSSKDLHLLYDVKTVSLI